MAIVISKNTVKKYKVNGNKKDESKNKDVVDMKDENKNTMNIQEN